MAAISALDNAKLFVLAWSNLTRVRSEHRPKTNHTPLLGFLYSKDLRRLFSLKETTLQYQFTMNHCPGKWHGEAAAVAQNPTHPAPNVPTNNSQTSEATDEITIAHSINNIIITLNESR